MPQTQNVPQPGQYTVMRGQTRMEFRVTTGQSPVAGKTIVAFRNTEGRFEPFAFWFEDKGLVLGKRYRGRREYQPYGNAALYILEASRLWEVTI